MIWTPFVFRDKPLNILSVPQSRFTILVLPESDTQHPQPSDPLTRLLFEHRLNGLTPWGGPSRWTDRVHPGFDPAVSGERHLLNVIGDPTLPLPRVPMAAIGGEAALRLGFRYPTLLPAVACWDGSLDFHELHGRGTALDELFERREQARQHTAILQVRQNDYPPHVWFGCPPDSDQFRGHDRLHEKLAAIGVPHEYVLADECPLAAMIAFVAAGLEKQSRRLL